MTMTKGQPKLYDNDIVNDDEDYLTIVRYYKSTDDTDFNFAFGFALLRRTKVLVVANKVRRPNL